MGKDVSHPKSSWLRKTPGMPQFPTCCALVFNSVQQEGAASHFPAFFWSTSLTQGRDSDSPLAISSSSLVLLDEEPFLAALVEACKVWTTEGLQVTNEKEISVIIYFTKLALSCSWSAASQNQDDLLEIKITTLQVLFCFQQGKKVKQIMRFNWNNWFYLNNYFSHIYYCESTHLNYSFHLYPSLSPFKREDAPVGSCWLKSYKSPQQHSEIILGVFIPTRNWNWVPVLKLFHVSAICFNT